VSQITYDIGFERIGDLVRDMDVARDRNEATTRLALIDRLLFDCLGWGRDEADLEDHERGQYADYVLSRERRRLVVEAKREGATFELPEGLDQVVNVEALFALGGETAAALEQVERYAHDRGIPYAAICNGHQLVAFIANRQDGIDVRRGRALVFPSPASMLAGFGQLWAGLNRGACAAMSLSRILGARVQTRPPKLAEQVQNYPGSARADERQFMLATLNVLFLPDYVRDDQNEDTFLLECYCPPGAFSRLAMLNRSVLRTRYSLALGEELKVGLDEAATKDGLNPALRDQVAASSAGKEPLVLLGDVGVGKTMFLRRLLRVDAKEIAEDGIILYTDLGRDAVLSEIKTFVAASFKKQLLERYATDIDAADFLRGTYQAEVARFGRGIHGELAKSDPDEFRRRQIDYLASLSKNVEEHMRRSLEHLVKLRRQQVVIVLDNIDQRRRTDQEQVFLLAESFAKSWPCTVFVTLRPESFNASRVSGALTGYQPRAFTVLPPRVENVVAKRLEFGAKHYEEHGRLPEWLGWTADSDDLRDYLGVLIKSFRRSDPLQRTLVNLSGGNARRALELMRAFVESPHAEHFRTLKRSRESEDGDYLVPAHDFLRAALLGDAAHYSPERSRIPNLFDITTMDTSEHFLLPCLLGLLSRESNRGEGEGYLLAEEAYRSVQSLGFSTDQVDFAMKRAMWGQLVEVLPPEAETDGIDSIRLTSVGAYAHQALALDFQYYDAVVIDTPIADASLRDGIRVVHAISARLDRAETFIDYLGNCWEESGLSEVDLFDWRLARSAVEKELARIRSRLS
jgi:hypothetical protein